MKPKVIEIKDGSAVARIYTGKNQGRPLFTAVWYDGATRIRRNFRNLADAKNAATKAVRDINTGQRQALHLTNEDAAIYVSAQKELPAGKRLNSAVSEFAAALKELKGTGTLLEAARFFARHHKAVEKKMIPEIVAEMIAGKKADGASKLYLSDLKKRLGRFGESFSTYIGNVTMADIEGFLRRLGGSPRSRNNARNCIVTLFRYARSRGYLPKERTTEADTVARAKERHGEVGILTPDEMRLLLTHAEKDMIPFLVIGAFAGLRHWEILRLQWEDVNQAAGHILVRAENTKTGARRIVPITSNLAPWLSPWAKMTGLVVAIKNMSDRLGALCAKDKVKIKWPRNALRHSYGSYRLAAIKNAPQVALEMGNSPQMIFKHYREVVTEKEAAGWFGIMPERPANVIAIQQKQAA